MNDTWEDIVARFRQNSLVSKSNMAASTVVVNIPQFRNDLKTYIKRHSNPEDWITSEAHQPKLLRLVEETQSYRENVAATQLDLLSWKRDLDKLWFICENWILDQPELALARTQKDQSRVVKRVLRELYDTLEDISTVLAFCETSMWSLKATFDSYDHLAKTLSQMHYANMKTLREGDDGPKAAR